MNPSLPIDQFLPSILKEVKESSSLVLTAAPGAGKTTRVPPALLQATEKAVWVLEPRRIAAISSAQRISEENRWQLGKEVGYQVRFDNRSSRETRLLFLTEALLLRKLMQDPELKEVGCVILDEFHERSLHVDLAISALKELQELSRPDLKLVIMSATLDSRPLSAFLGEASVIDVPGKLFPMKVIYEEKPQLLRTGPEFISRITRLIQRAAAECPEGDILCFLPGRGEIEWVKREIGAWADSADMSVCPLHGQLSLAEQKAAILPLKRGRKLILATNVAESSLTVEGVRIVIDSGLARISQLHPRTGYESLDLVRISKASATQRAGRSARLGPGTVYRAWMTYDELSFKEYETPEIQRTDLAEPALLLAAIGIRNLQSFSWYDRPPEKSLSAARSFLVALGAIDLEGGITDLGRKLQKIPLHPRLAKFLLRGNERGIGSLSCELAALVSEPGSGFRPGLGGEENDLWLRWQDWKRNPARNISRAADQLKSLLGPSINDQEKHGHALEKEMLSLLLETYPDRLCRRRRAHEPQAKMAGGRGVKLHPDSSVKASEYFLAIDLAEGRELSEALVFQAVGIPETMLENLAGAEKQTLLEWDEEKGRFFVEECKVWNGLPIGRGHRRPADAAEIEGKLAEVIFSDWESFVSRNENLSQWLARLRELNSYQEKWPLLGEDEIRGALELACYNESSLDNILRKDLVPFFEGQLGTEHREALERECPASWRVPSGSRLKIKYTEDQGPQVEVRLQELFGLKSQPKVAGKPLTLFLLAPNFRPVQVTKDLESFWANAYGEVRKEMRARYPKHSWPEDPLSAPPQAKGKPRGAL